MSKLGSERATCIMSQILHIALLHFSFAPSALARVSRQRASLPDLQGLAHDTLQA